LVELVFVGGYLGSYAVYVQRAYIFYPNSLGHAFGTVLAPALGVALFPVTRRSVLLPALGMSYERAAVAHRVTSQAAIVTLAVHIGLTVHERGVAALRSSAATLSGLGNAYGTAAAACIGAMAVLASPPVRAASYELFKLSHLLLMPAVVVLACLHAELMVGYIVPPLALYAVDRALSMRLAARSLSGRVTRLPLGAVRLEVTVPRGMQVDAGQWAYVCVPLLSMAEWHPFSLACAVGQAQTRVRFLLRGSSGDAAFSARLAALVPEGQPGADVIVRLDGPLGRPLLPLASYTAVLLVAGGVGITPMVSHMSALLADKSAQPRIHLLWVAKEAEAFDAWLPGWLPELAARGVAVTCACTQAAAESEASSAFTIQSGRPDLMRAVRCAVESAGGAASQCAVFACGPESLVDAAGAAAYSAGCAFAHEAFGL
jgi:predicted ferric reductase